MVKHFATGLLVILILIDISPAAAAGTCTPTAADMLGPFYREGAQVRSSVGKGYVLEGTVKEAGTCTAVPGARIEFWLAGPDGAYADAYRATLFADAAGRYRFESHEPPPYYGRPPHVHLRVSAKGYRTLVTQHYPEKGAHRGTFDLVLVPEE